MIRIGTLCYVLVNDIEVWDTSDVGDGRVRGTLNVGESCLVIGETFNFLEVVTRRGVGYVISTYVKESR